jgi:hypothetical protein
MPVALTGTGLGNAGVSLGKSFSHQATFFSNLSLTLSN